MIHTTSYLQTLLNQVLSVCPDFGITIALKTKFLSQGADILPSIKINGKDILQILVSETTVYYEHQTISS